MNPAQYQSAYEQLFADYSQQFSIFYTRMEYEIPRSLRLFDIRFRLALSLQVSFDSQISYTKTESTRRTYALILKLNDLWFAYEGLFQICKDQNWLKTNATKATPFTLEMIQNLGLDDWSQAFAKKWQQAMLQNTRFHKDCMGYIDYLQTTASGKTQQRLLAQLLSQIQQPDIVEFNTQLALIYAIRNMYVHNTDTAKSGVKQYKTKIEILRMSNDFLTLVILEVANQILADYIAELTSEK